MSLLCYITGILNIYQGIVMNELSRGCMQFSNFEEAMRYGELISKSKFCPKDLVGRPGDIIIAIQWGAEVGLSPLQALQSICVINGRPSIYGDAMLALCKKGSDFEYVKEWHDHERNIAWCEAKRKGEEAQVRGFSEADARKAGLWGRTGPWTTYPLRMLQCRARGFALRDVFPHHLMGLITAEEAYDYDVIPTEVRVDDPQPQLPPNKYSAEYHSMASELKQMVGDGVITPQECEGMIRKAGYQHLDQILGVPELVQKAHAYFTKREREKNNVSV